MAKPAAAKKGQEDSAGPQKKSKKKLILIIIVVILLIAGGVVAYLLLKPAPTSKHAPPPAAVEEAEPEPGKHESAAKFVDLGQFTANLVKEDEDRYIQIAISLKISKAELEEKIKDSKPEILHRVNMLLQSKKPSELSTFDGKDKLAQQIKAQAEYVLGLRKISPPISAPASAVPDNTPSRSGVTEVLFTSFIIQ